jgi:hypothetical protein
MWRKPLALIRRKEDMRNHLLIGGAVSNILLAKTFEVSGNNLSADADQYIFVKQGATSPQVVAAAASDPILGVSQDTNINGRGVSVGLVGITKLVIGGAVTHGERLRSDASGRAVRHLGLGVYGAIALEDGSSANDVIEALLVGGGFTSSG